MSHDNTQNRIAELLEETGFNIQSIIDQAEKLANNIYGIVGTPCCFNDNQELVVCDAKGVVATESCYDQAVADVCAGYVIGKYFLQNSDNNEANKELFNLILKDDSDAYRADPTNDVYVDLINAIQWFNDNIGYDCSCELKLELITSETID